MEKLKSYYAAGFIFLAILLVCASSGEALVVTTSSPFSITQSAVTPASGFSYLELFDGTLGTLDSVDVQVTGSMSLSGSTVPQIVYPAGPVPYAFNLTVHQYIAGPDDYFFDAAAPALYSFTVFATGAGAFAAAPFSTPFSFGFSFDSPYLTGETAAVDYGPSLTPSYIGALGGFEGPAGLYQLEFMQQPVVTSSYAPNQAGLLIDTTGTITIQYNYTPPSEPAPVPEPATIYLLGCGLAAFALGRMKSRK